MILCTAHPDVTYIIHVLFGFLDNYACRNNLHYTCIFDPGLNIHVLSLHYTCVINGFLRYAMQKQV